MAAAAVRQGGGGGEQQSYVGTTRVSTHTQLMLYIKTHGK